MIAHKQVNYLVVGASGLLYFYLFYFISRHDSLPLIATYSILFLAYLLMVKNSAQFNIRWLIVISLLFRIIPLLALPTLSDDFYRFIWDGRLWAAGINPFAGLPSEYLGEPSLIAKGITGELYGLLNSPSHYTVYPPVPQYINWLAAKLFSNNIAYSVFLMRTLIIGAEMVSILFIYLLLKKYNLKHHLIAIYAFNPLVIIEISGNLHHEGLMITFLLGFLYFNAQQKMPQAAVMLALSIASKLLPLMFLPFILLNIKHWFKFSVFLLVSMAILFLPLLDQSFINGMQDSLTLYYQNFEFNAGLYYLFREVGYWVYGYNAIALIGKILLSSSTVLIVVFSYLLSVKKFNYTYSFTILYLIFALLSLIFHPWYVIIMLALAPFTKFKFPIVWSYLIFLTYVGYSQAGFRENYYIVAIEFVGLCIALFVDARTHERSSLNLNAAP
jgi:alpha-1,6-mannosyltransferase